MTRAEIASLEAYPLRFDLPDDLLRRMLHGGERKYFQEGYERAEKDTIERAIAWLEKHANDYIVDLTPTYPDAPSQIIIGGKCWEDLKKAMEEQR